MKARTHHRMMKVRKHWPIGHASKLHAKRYQKLVQLRLEHIIANISPHRRIAYRDATYVTNVKQKHCPTWPVNRKAADRRTDMTKHYSSQNSFQWLQAYARGDNKQISCYFNPNEQHHLFAFIKHTTLIFYIFLALRTFTGIDIIFWIALSYPLNCETENLLPKYPIVAQQNMYA